MRRPRLIPIARGVQAARAGLSALAAAGLAACTIGPDYHRPTVDTPQAYTPAGPKAQAEAPDEDASAPKVSAPSERLAQSDAARAAYKAAAEGTKELLDTAWWASFGDPQLDGLIKAALDQNTDLQIAALRVEQFDAYLQVSQSAGLPQAGYRGERTRDTLSANRQVPLAVGVAPVANNFEFSGAISWELDLWGKVRRANEAATADLMASKETQKALAESLISQVAAGYVQLLSLDRELVLLRQAIASNREQVRLAEAAFKGGGNSEVPVLHALAELNQRLAELPGKEAAITVLENQLSILVGRNPGPIARGKTFDELTLPNVPGGLPADLLAQRPDIRQAEQELIAANAKIGVAKGQYLPSISLTSSSGFASADLATLTQLTSNFGSFGVAVLGPIYTGGRLSGQVRAAEAVQKQAAIAYLRSLQTALREVDDALVSHRQLGLEGALREQQIAALREQQRLAHQRFDDGYTSYFPVLDADQALIAGQLLQNDARRDNFKTLIAVYKAMGGGWSLPELTASQATPPK